MLKRNIDKTIQEWITNGKKALLITGARQVGKTESIRFNLEKSAVDYVELNFITEPNLIKLFNNANNLSDMLDRLKFATDKELYLGKTIFFIDEVQECKEMLTIIKFLVEEGSFRYILSGSLLGVELNNLRSAPVGSLQIEEMFPLSLDEYFNAMKINKNNLAQIKNNLKSFAPINNYIHDKLLSIFNKYLITGGMPEVVQAYVDRGNFNEVRKIQEDIIKAYKIDFTKYEENKKLILREIYNSIPGQLNEQNKRFKLSKINKNYKFDRTQNSFLWLKEAGVAYPAYNVTEPKAPLILNEKRTLFKLYMSDVGLLTSNFSKETSFKILNSESSINKGSLYENVVAQELIANKNKLYYYNSKKFGEIDFLLEKGEDILPIEVKSGKDFKRHSAITNLLNIENYDIGKAVVLHNENIEVKTLKSKNNTPKQIIFLPIYMMMFL